MYRQSRNGSESVEVTIESVHDLPAIQDECGTVGRHVGYWVSAVCGEFKDRAALAIELSPLKG